MSSSAMTREAANTRVGPVSARLLARLSEETRQHGLLVWLDRDQLYTELVDSIREGQVAFPFPVLGYRGSFLDLMLAAEDYENDVRVEPLVIHLPEFNEEEVKRTPALELYSAGRRYRVGLETLVREAAQGKVVPSAIEARMAEGLTSLDDADIWLAATIAQEEKGDEGIHLGLGAPPHMFDELAQRGPLIQRLADPAALRAALAHLERTMGLEESWRTGIETRFDDPGQQLQLLMSSWALCVEFANDLQREPKDSLLSPLRRLSKSIVAACSQFAEHLRQSHPKTYARDADLIENDLTAEVIEATAEDLGKIDTLRFEDRVVFAAALQALEGSDWDRAGNYVADRKPENSFWVRHDHARRTGWQLVGLASELGRACRHHEALLTGARDLGEVAARYAESGSEVDGLQRQLEQARSQLALVQLDELPRLRACLNHVRVEYRRWADAQAVAFNALCKSQGFLPEGPLQQRTLFNEVVHPSTQVGVTAYFVVDALRYEMGRELLGLLERESGAQVALNPRFAELPTLTEVGMNVLAPVARDGRLEPEIGDAIKGFRTGSKRIASPADRKQAMHERVGGETCPWLPLEDVLERDESSLKQAIARARLVVVHSEGLDKSGEKGVGLRHFEDELQRIRAAWAKLRDAGISRFVLTADHGFLLQDKTTRKPVSHGPKTQPKRRHVIERAAADHAGEVRVSSVELLYGGDPVHFMFPETTMPFDVGARTKDFLHGGNSLQERVIPVLTAVYKHARGGGGEGYVVQAESLPPVMGMHRIKVTVEFAGDGLPFGASDEVELRLQAMDGEGVGIEYLDAPGARIAGGAVVATAGAAFELFFRLSADQARKTRVAVQGVFGDKVEGWVSERRFSADVVPSTEPSTDVPAADAGEDWLAVFEDERVRSVLAHIARFGAINEADATQLLGSPRRFRQFSQRVETYMQKAPFEIRIDVSSGQKRYVKEGGRDVESA